MVVVYCGSDRLGNMTSVSREVEKRRTGTLEAAALPDWDWLSCDSPGRSYYLCGLIYGILLNYSHYHSDEWFRQTESLYNWRSIVEKVLHFRPVIKVLVKILDRRWSFGRFVCLCVPPFLQSTFLQSPLNLPQQKFRGPAFAYGVCHQCFLSLHLIFNVFNGCLTFKS